MSADEFDPMIERLFARTPPLADEALFLAVFQARLEKRSRWRSLILMAAGLIGGGLALPLGLIMGYSRLAFGLFNPLIQVLRPIPPIAFIPLAAFFGVLSIGGDYATRKADLPSDFVLVFVGLMFLFMIVTQYVSARRSRGEPILPARLRRSRAAAGGDGRG